jgi:hypothetical protein
MESFSQIGQDKIVLKYLKNKQNGFFVDIGCGYPKNINNTYLLESKYNWNGISIDLNDCKEDNGEGWESIRKTKRILSDALTINYSDLFKNNNLPYNIDYLSLDLEPPELTLECLYKIPFDEYNFNVISFEIDTGREGDYYRISKSREFLQSKGYTLIGSLCGGQDDIYIHNSISYLINEFKFEDPSIGWTTWPQSKLYK